MSGIAEGRTVIGYRSILLQKDTKGKSVVQYRTTVERRAADVLDRTLDWAARKFGGHLSDMRRTGEVRILVMRVFGPDPEQECLPL